MPREISESTQKDLDYLALGTLFREQAAKIDGFNFKEFVDYIEVYFQ